MKRKSRKLLKDKFFFLKKKQKNKNKSEMYQTFPSPLSVKRIVKSTFRFFSFLFSSFLFSNIVSYSPISRNLPLCLSIYYIYRALDQSLFLQRKIKQSVKRNQSLPPFPPHFLLASQTPRSSRLFKKTVFASGSNLKFSYAEAID